MYALAATVQSRDMYRAFRRITGSREECLPHRTPFPRMAGGVWPGDVLRVQEQRAVGVSGRARVRDGDAAGTRRQTSTRRRQQGASTWNRCGPGGGPVAGPALSPSSSSWGPPAEALVGLPRYHPSCTHARPQCNREGAVGGGGRDTCPAGPDERRPDPSPR